ncbi:MAG: hypothetical protein R2825_14505 [Saprospiraceae bacterium]
MDKRQLIKSIKDNLNLTNFKPVHTGVDAVSLMRDTDLYKEEIVISYRRYPGVFHLGPAIIGFKTFKEVDQILSKYFAKAKLPDNGVTIHLISRRDEHIGDVGIENEKEIEQVLPSLRKMIFDDILPFFEQYNSLSEVHSKIDSLNGIGLANFVYNPPHPRIMVIKKLVNAKDWEIFCQDSIQIYEEQSLGKYKYVFAPIFGFLPDLYEELKSISHT